MVILVAGEVVGNEIYVASWRVAHGSEAAVSSVGGVEAVTDWRKSSRASGVAIVLAAS